jgi:hypothetical protein
MQGGNSSRRARLRRIDSFRRLSALPEHLQTWASSSKALHIELEGFVEDLARVHGPSLREALEVILAQQPPSSSSLVSGSAWGADVTQLPHALHQHYVNFCEHFEKLLTAELRDTCNVEDEEFEAVMEIAALEERRDGLHFYRWLNILDMEVFVKMLVVALKLEVTTSSSTTIACAFAAFACGSALSPANLTRDEFPAVRVALQHVSKLSDVARAARRRRTCLRPLIFSWSPPDFASVLKVVDCALAMQEQQKNSSTTLKSVFAPPKHHLKELARWRNRLLAKTINSNGVYEAQRRSDEDWVRYLEMLCEAMPSDVFGEFVLAMNDCVKKDSESRSAEEISAMATRREIFQLFDKLDTTFSDRVDLHDWLSDVSAPSVAELLFGSPSAADESDRSHRVHRALQKLTLRCVAEYRTNHGNDAYVLDVLERATKKRATEEAVLTSSRSASAEPVLERSRSVTKSGEESAMAVSGGKMCELQAPITLEEFRHIVLVTYELASREFREQHDVAGMCRAVRDLLSED